jgi:hypothetical protein
MLQLNRSQATNTNAVYPDVTASVGTTSVLLEFTQSYDYSKTTGVTASLANTVGPLNPWLVIQLTGSSVPTASGQYDVNIWTYTLSGGNLGTWIQTTSSFTSEQNRWGGGTTPVKDVLLSTERAYVSGSNEYTITQYSLPTNGGTYTTYNHP